LCRWPGGATARLTRERPSPGEPALFRFARPTLLIAGALQSAIALVLLLSPATMIEHWPWTLTPLTAQTLGGWFALPGVTALMMGLNGALERDPDHAASQLSGLALILLGTARAWEDVDTGNALAYAFVAGMAALFVALPALEWFMVARERAGAASARAADTRVAAP
jgi:hypothetical protein